jgi:hypothetical protein
MKFHLLSRIRNIRHVSAYFGLDNRQCVQSYLINNLPNVYDHTLAVRN